MTTTKRHRRLWIWVNSGRPRKKREYVRWNAYSHEVLKPKALRNYNRRCGWDSFQRQWMNALAYNLNVRLLPWTRAVCSEHMPFQEALHLGLMVRALNKE